MPQRREEMKVSYASKKGGNNFCNRVNLGLLIRIDTAPKTSKLGVELEVSVIGVKI